MLYDDDFTKIEKTRETIAEYLLKAVYEIANLNILQIVNGNAYNCKVGPCEIEKWWLRPNTELIDMPLSYTLKF